jgi:hypothetical protein
VTLDGKPLAGATVNFTPVGEGGGAAVGATDDSGRYELFYGGSAKGAMPGSYVATVNKEVEVEMDDMGNVLSEGEQLPIPEKYMSAETSPLKFEVTQGSNEINLELKSGG